MGNDKWYETNQTYPQNPRGYMSSRQDTYSGNRCARCNHKLSDPSKVYGAYCASRL